VSNSQTYPVALEVAGAFVPSFTGVTWEGGTQPAYVAGMVYRFIVRKDSGGTVTIFGSGESASGVGINQTWQNMTGSRALSTTYTNSTGKPIMISITTNTDSGSGQALGITVAGVLVVDDRSTSGVSQTSAVIIPDGATYSAASNRTLRLWAELR
jgi:hypothetical protein